MSAQKFYRLGFDPDAYPFWFLGEPVDPSGNEIDARIFTCGVPVAPQPPLTIPIREAGKEVGFNLAAFDMVVTPVEINKQLEALVGPVIQRIPVTIDGRKDEFEILNVCSLVTCVDESRSTCTWWTEEDGRPDKVGKYRMIIDLMINPLAAEGHHIFRVAEWRIALMVSETVKNLFEANNLTGIAYRRVD